MTPDVLRDPRRAALRDIALQDLPLDVLLDVLRSAISLLNVGELGAY